MAGESKLQAKGRKFMQRKGWMAVKMNNTSRPGWPDFYYLKNGRSVWIEWKDDKNLDPLQKYIHEQIKLHGGEVYKVGTWEEFVATGLQKW
jgi:hypothetical protein